MSADTIYNEKELLVLIQNGDEAAFSKLFHHHKNRIYGIAYKLCGSAVLAEEAVQDVFLKIWLRRNDLNQVENLSAYINTIVRNTLYKTLKRLSQAHVQNIEVGSEVASDINHPELSLMEKQYQSMLQKGIETLPNQQKQVYQLIRERGMKRNEVADLLQLQPETVKYHLAKAVKNLWSYCRLHLHLWVVLASIFFSFFYQR